MDASVFATQRKTLAAGDQRKRSSTVLLVDEGGRGMGADRVPRGASLSS